MAVHFTRLFGITIVFLVSAIPAMANGSLFGSTETLVGLTDQKLDAARLERLMRSEFSDQSQARGRWQVVIELLQFQPDRNKLALVQQFFNSQPYLSDLEVYGRSDYWSSTEEFLETGGDCEDFAIAKYRALIESGYDESQLRIVLVEDRITRTAHAVLAAYEGEKVVILDNQRGKVVSHEEIGHYRPLYSFNQRYVWQHRMDPSAPSFEDVSAATRNR